MKTWLILLVVMLHSTVGLCVELPDESEMAPFVNHLKSEKPEVREAAAAALRKIAATNQKAIEQAGEYWKSKLALIKQGMTSAEVHKILPPCAAEPQIRNHHQWQSHNEDYRLDYHWTITVNYNNPDSVHHEPPVLRKREMDVGVVPPKTFTGKCTGWYTNGEKFYDVEYKDGEFDGLFITYYDNRQKESEQRYSNGQVNGSGSGWHENGVQKYVVNYKDGKQIGMWTWWYANGTKQFERTFKDGVEDGQYMTWYENGKPMCEFNFKDGKRVGREASWDENGKLQYERQRDSEP